MNIAALPSEIALHIISYLEAKDLIHLQSTCHHLFTLAREPAIWKAKCFEESHARRRMERQLEMVQRQQQEQQQQQQPGDSQGQYADLLHAMRAMVGFSGLPSVNTQRLGNDNHPAAEMEAAKVRARERQRIMANWDPSYPQERIDYYEEYVQRYAPITVDWFEGVGMGEDIEVTGVGILYGDDGAVAEKVIGAKEDGSVCVWEADEHNRRGRLLARSQAGLLTACKEDERSKTKAMMTETGAIECVSVDSTAGRAYFGVLNELVEVDVASLKVMSREPYPFPITALSQARFPTPMTVGTSMTLHLYDPRDGRGKVQKQAAERSTRLELINGGHDFARLLTGDRSISQSSFATLIQPGPLSILHTLEDGDWDGNGEIWVAGRFTSLLNYDRRFFPRLRGHLHSGARFSCLRSSPNPFLPRELGMMSTHSMSAAAIAEVKSIPGTTLLAAGEYKGKGSLELYGLSSDPAYTTLATDCSPQRQRQTSFLNRQTASASKLLSVSPHGGKIVYTDGDGNIKWVERDGFSPIRTWNLNSLARDPTTSDYMHPTPSLFSAPGEAGIIPPPPDDIVQLLLPMRPKSTTVRSTTASGQDNLLIWTGEGKLGLLGFGTKKFVAAQSADIDNAVEHAEIAEKRREERDYDVEMGQALRAHANELNFLRGLGMGST